MKDLINMTYGLGSIPVASDVTGDEQLGQLVIESEMNEDVNSVPEKAMYLLDKEKIGRFQRYNDGGIYWRGKYIAAGHYELPEVYDSVHLPEKPAVTPSVFFLQLRAPDGIGGTACLSLPADRNEADRVAQELGENCIEGCTLYDFESVIPQIGAGKFEMQDFNILNSIAGIYSCMSEMEQIKYKAVLTAEDCRGRHRLWDALEAAEHISEYELAYYADNNADFATAYLAHHLPAGFDIRWLDMVREAGLGAELLKRLDATLTEYGVISARGKSLFTLLPAEETQEQAEKVQALTGETFDGVEICGQTALFSNGRYTDDAVPAGLYKYELREAAGSEQMTIEKSVLVDHGGTIFLKKTLDFGDERYLIPDEDSSLNFLGYDMTMGEFLHTDFTQETGGMQL